MIFATGDIHGVPWQVYKFAKKHKLTYDDVIIIPGDVGANFYGGEKDEEFDRMMLAPGFETATYVIPKNVIENGCVDLEFSEPYMGVMFTEFRITHE